MQLEMHSNWWNCMLESKGNVYLQKFAAKNWRGWQMKVAEICVELTLHSRMSVWSNVHEFGLCDSVCVILQEVLCCVLFFKRCCVLQNFSFEIKEVMDTDFHSGLTTFNAGALTMVSSNILWKKSYQNMTVFFSCLTMRWLSGGAFSFVNWNNLHDRKWQNASQLSDDKWVIACTYVMGRTANLNECNFKLKWQGKLQCDMFYGM